ncbi:MAG: hypothetical protein NTX45_16815 [Proteobacteria bacterium]|nr:hypothetical protein [Pseudomonadota bacterium]
MQAPYTESKRVKAFRLKIAKEIPKFPNNKATLQTLEVLSLGSILIHYNNWAIRYVSTRPRSILIEKAALTDQRWISLDGEISAFLEKVKTGEDITSHLSLEPHTRGYTPAPSAGNDKWADKDFLLTVMGYHHFHLGSLAQENGFAMRTNDLLFTKVSRDIFTVVAIFDHSVFEKPVSPTEAMSAERERLWNVFDEHSSRGVTPGTVYISSPITTSGHSSYLVHLAADYARVVREIDPKLDDILYVKELYKSAGVSYYKTPKLKWHLNLLDLGLLDEKSGAFFVFRYGAN